MNPVTLRNNVVKIVTIGQDESTESQDTVTSLWGIDKLI